MVGIASQHGGHRAVGTERTYATRQPFAMMNSAFVRGASVWKDCGWSRGSSTWSRVWNATKVFLDCCQHNDSGLARISLWMIVSVVFTVWASRERKTLIGRNEK